MQVLWMLMITLVLALSGVFRLAVVTHAAARTRRRRSDARAVNRMAPSPRWRTPGAAGPLAY